MRFTRLVPLLAILLLLLPLVTSQGDSPPAPPVFLRMAPGGYLYLSNPDSVLLVVGTDSHWFSADYLNMDGNKIINLATPVEDGDAVTKLYCDNQAAGGGSTDSMKVDTGDGIRYNNVTKTLVLTEGVAIDIVANDDTTAYYLLSINVDTSFLNANWEIATADQATKDGSGNTITTYYSPTTHDHDLNYCPIDPDSSDIMTASVTEAIFDRVIGMLSGNTETGITVTGQDIDNTIDFEVDVKVTDSAFALADFDGTSIDTNATGQLQIPDGGVGTNEIANGSILFADWAQNSATTGQIPKWSGSAWAAAADASDALWAASTNGDTVYYIDGTDTCFIINIGGGIFQFGKAGLATVDSIEVGDFIRFVGADTIVMNYALLDSIINQKGVFDPGEDNTISDTGTYNNTSGFGLAGGKTGVSLKVKGLIEGSNITITQSGDSGLVITGAAGGSGSEDSLVIRAGSADYSILSNALRLYFRYGLLSVAADSGTVVDTISVKVDTSGLNSTWKIATASLADDVDTTGVKVAAALANRTTDGEFAKITDDTTNFKTAYDWGNHASAGYLTGVSLLQVFNHFDRDYVDTNGAGDSLIVIAADSSGKALADAAGNVITSTYLTSPVSDGDVPNDITITESNDVDTTGTKIAAALAGRATTILVGKLTDDSTSWNTAYGWGDHSAAGYLADNLITFYKYFDRTYFDTLIDASGDSIVCIYADSTDITNFDTDDLVQGASNLYNQTHTGDVTGSVTLDIASGVVGTAEIGNGSILFEDIAQNSATTDQVMTWSGSAWTASNQATGLTLANLFALCDRTYFDTTTAFATDSLIVIFAEAADSSGKTLQDASGNTITSFYSPTTHNHDAAYAPITPDSTEIDSANIREWVADKVGGMVTGNTETNITVTYDDADNTLDFVVGAGSIDSTGIVETTTGTDSTLWNVDQPWRLRAGIALLSEHGDSANVDTVNFSVDTTVTATRDYSDDSTAAVRTDLNKIGDDTTSWKNVATLFDTNYSSLTAGGQTIDNDTSIVSEGELEDSLDSYSLTTAISSTYETITNVGKIGDDTTNFKTAHGWGDHSAQTYLTETGGSNAVIDADVPNDITITESSDVDTSGTKIAAALAHRNDSIANHKTIIDKLTADSLTWTKAADTVAAWDNGALKVDSTYYADTANILKDFFAVGDCEITGRFRPWMYKADLDIDKYVAQNNPDYLRLLIPDEYFINGVDTTHADSFATLHPSVVYIPGGWPRDNKTRFKYWLCETPYPGGMGDENPCIHVSNDMVRWHEFYRGDDSGSGEFDAGIFDSTLHNPVFDNLHTIVESHDTANGYNDTATFLSDCEFFYGHDDKLWMMFRADWSHVMGHPNIDTIGVMASYTSNGLDWSTPVRAITAWGDSTGAGDCYMSPAVVADSGGTYKMWWVENMTGEVDEDNVIIMSTASDPEGPWTTVDTTDIVGVGTDDGIWHIDVVAYGPDQYVMIICEKPSPYALYLATSYDGINWTQSSDPVLEGTGDNSDWDWAIYRTTGMWVDKGDQWNLGLFYSGAPADSCGVGYTEAYILGPGSVGQWEVVNFENVYGRDDGGDSVILTLEQMVSSKYCLLTDSCYGNLETDNFGITGCFPWDFTAETLFVTYQTSDATENMCEITDISISGPDFSSGTNCADSAYWSSSTDYGAATLTRQAISLGTENFNQGDKAGVGFNTYFYQPGEWLRIFTVQIKGRRR